MSDERVLNILLKALNTTKFNDLICVYLSIYLSAQILENYGSEVDVTW